MRSFVNNMKVSVEFTFSRYPLRVCHRAITLTQSLSLRHLTFPNNPASNTASTQNILWAFQFFGIGKGWNGRCTASFLMCDHLSCYLKSTWKEYCLSGLFIKRFILKRNRREGYCFNFFFFRLLVIVRHTYINFHIPSIVFAKVQLVILLLLLHSVHILLIQSL